jgi:hypothetical protein
MKRAISPVTKQKPPLFDDDEKVEKRLLHPNRAMALFRVGRFATSVFGLTVLSFYLLLRQAPTQEKKGTLLSVPCPTVVEINPNAATNATSHPISSKKNEADDDAANDDEDIFTSSTRKELWKHLDCDDIVEKELPIHSQETWTDMRRRYISIVGLENSTVGNLHSEYNGFAQPYYVRHNQYGRGIYAAVDIPQGALVWQGLRTAVFDNADQFRKFLKQLTPELACDVLQWSYVDFSGTIDVDLDEGSFCNNGGKKRSNIGYDNQRLEKFPIKDGSQLFALRDISADEELLCDYGSFTSGGWSKVGM